MTQRWFISAAFVTSWSFLGLLICSLFVGICIFSSLVVVLCIAIRWWRGTVNVVFCSIALCAWCFMAVGRRRTFVTPRCSFCACGFVFIDEAFGAWPLTAFGCHLTVVVGAAGVPQCSFALLLTLHVVCWLTVVFWLIRLYAPSRSTSSRSFGCDRHWMGVWVVVCAFCCLLLWCVFGFWSKVDSNWWRGDVYVENKYKSSMKEKDFWSSKDPVEDSISFLYCFSCT